MSKDTEHLIQCAFIEWVKAHIKIEPRLEALFAIPNGGRRGYRTAVKMKLEGLKPGVWDLFLACPHGGYCGLWIEMKAPGGRLSPEQLEWGDMMRDYGYKAVLCRSQESAAKEVQKYLDRDFNTWESESGEGFSR